jgi:hypothetical protein
MVTIKSRLLSCALVNDASLLNLQFFLTTYSLAGFLTAKGELVRSILFPKPVDFKFSQDSMKFIMVLALISLAGMIYTLVLMVNSSSSFIDLIEMIDIDGHK